MATTKKVENKKIAKTRKKTTTAVKEHYIEAVGRRKTAVARIRLYTQKKGIEVNSQDLKDYFSGLSNFQEKVLSPLEKMKVADKFGATVKVEGGGVSAQAEAIRLGISRALVKFNTDFKK